ncbi:MAG TPA: DUF2911 domain-containing protein [Vicinamibacterales bacterium]|jgi:hypothetical protein
MKRFATLVAAVLLFPHGGHAQGGRPASPAGASAAEATGRYNERGAYVGGKWIEIRYGRPIKRGRDLFGPSDFAEALNDGAPVWRAGANVSTRLITELPLVIGGKRLAPGEYTLFIDLKRSDWTLIVSSWPAQTTYDDKNKQALWGAYDYTPDKDIVRAPMKVENLPHAFEQLSWELVDVTDSGGRLAMLWDKKLASVPFTFTK